MVKSLPNRIYLKQNFFGFKMHEGKLIDENIDESTKLVLDLESLGVKIEDEPNNDTFKLITKSVWSVERHFKI